MVVEEGQNALVGRGRLGVGAGRDDTLDGLPDSSQPVSSASASVNSPASHAIFSRNAWRSRWPGLPSPEGGQELGDTFSNRFPHRSAAWSSSRTPAVFSYARRPPMISPRTSTAGPRLQHEVGEHRWPCREVMPARTRVLRWLRAFLDTSPNTDTIKSITPPTSGTPQRYAIVREQREVLVELGTAEGPLERAMASSHLSVITDRLIQSQRRAQITHILSTQRLRWSRVRASAAQGTRRPIMIFRSGARDSEQPCPRHQT